MELTTEGYIFLITAWTVILSIVGFSFYKVFKGNKKEEKV